MGQFKKKKNMELLEPDYRDGREPTPQKQADRLQRLFYILSGFTIIWVVSLALEIAARYLGWLDIESFRFARAIAILFLIISFFTWWMLHTRLWLMVQGVEPRTDPFYAALLMIIPVFAYYWQFVSFRGLVLDFNKLIVRQKVAVEPIGTSIATVYCILNIIAVFFVNTRVVIGPSHLIMGIGILMYLQTYSKMVKAAKAVLLTGPQWEGKVDSTKPWEDETQSETKIVTPPQPKRYDPSMIGKKAPGK